ncbi:MAG: DUF2971 domain-containing protein [Clostridiales bacterium]|nr:DUF2971 domain-containing protein [Clostridiales bacterium]
MNNEVKKKYFDIFIERGWNEAKAFLLKHIKDEKLYCYRSGRKYDFENIEKKQFSLSNASRFNDPFDCTYLIDAYKDRIFASEDWEEGYKCYKTEKEAEIISKQKQSEVFVTCFSEKSNSMLMWAHYANSTQGICLEYDFKELIENLDEGCYLLPIFYRRDYPDYSQKENEKRKIYTGIVTKNMEWEYESEWRMIKIDSESREKIRINVKGVMPKKIFIGYRYPEKITKEERENGERNFNEVLEFASMHRIEPRLSRLHLSNYEISYIEIKGWRNIGSMMR